VEARRGSDFILAAEGPFGDDLLGHSVDLRQAQPGGHRPASGQNLAQRLAHLDGRAVAVIEVVSQGLANDSLQLGRYGRVEELDGPFVEGERRLKAWVPAGEQVVKRSTQGIQVAARIGHAPVLLRR
jgi:hypothetical protein